MGRRHAATLPRPKKNRMDAAIVNDIFPSWTTMLAVDVSMTLFAGAATYLAVLRWPLLSRADAKLGVALILSGFWCLAGLYIYDLFTMTVLPEWRGMAAAMEEMHLIHERYSWYVLLASAALIVAGLASTSKRLENLDRQLQASKAEAEMQNAQKTSFLASMSHELRTPLNAIMGYAEFMQLDPIAGEKDRCREYAANIHASAEMLHDLIADLLDLSRIEQGRVDLRFERVDLGSLVRESIEKSNKLRVGGAVRIILDVAPEIGPLYLDRRAIEQVILNLVANSAKHTPPDGSIRIGIDRTARGDARIVVTDTGSGIPPRILAHIFDPYVSGDPLTRDTKGGYGLGLSICKRLIDAHGGSISVKSELGKGATVTVILPRDSKGAWETEIAEPAPGPERVSA